MKAKGLPFRITLTSFFEETTAQIGENKHWLDTIMDSVSLHFIGAACRMIQSDSIPMQCLGLRCFHHDVLWQHNYALYLASHGSSNHISCSLESSIPAATAELRERVEGWGRDERGGEAWSLKLSKWNAKAVDWRPDAEGLNRDVGGAPVVFHFASTSDYGHWQDGQQISHRGARVAKVCTEQERRVLILKPVLPQCCT